MNSINDVDEVIEIVFKELKKRNAINANDVTDIFPDINRALLLNAFKTLREEYKLSLFFSSIHSLSLKGRRYKSVKSYLKYSNRPYIYTIISIIVAVLFGFLAAYQKYSYNDLKDANSTLKSQRDSLISRYDSLTYSIDSLKSRNAQYKDSLFVLKSNINNLKSQPLPNTLQTKN